MDFSTPAFQTKKGMADKVESPQKTYFFQREDGSIFSVQETAAWTIYSGKSQTIGWRIPTPKLIGTSDGRITSDAIREARAIFNTEGLEKAQAYIREAQDRELEEAKKHPEAPRNFDTLDDRGRPTRISDLR